MRRAGVTPEGVVTFRNLTTLVTPELDAVLDRYPVTVQRHVRNLVGGERRGNVNGRPPYQS